MTTLAPETVLQTDTRCVHCSLPVPAGRLNGEGDQFCCSGCEAANAAIRSCGLEEYYELRRRMESGSAPAETSADRFDAFDDPAFTARHCRGAPEGRMTCELYLTGLHCAACVWLLERLPRVVGGLIALEVDYGRRTARAVWNPHDIALSSLCREIARFGYVPCAVEPSATRDARRGEERAMLVRLGVAGACAGNVMLIAFALYSGHFSSIEEPYRSVFLWLSAAIGVLSIAWPGRVFFTSALMSLRARVWSLDAPIALALLVGAVTGTINVARGSGEIYFDTLTMLVFLLLGGRWLQMRQQRAAHDAVELLFSVTPRHARLVEDDGVREVSSASLEEGMVVEVLANESVPADGLLLSEEAMLDESVLSGESAPVRRGQGEQVVAGAVNRLSTLRLEVSRVGRDTRVGQMMALIERLSRSRTPIIGSADRIARPFVLGVVTLALITALVHVSSGFGIAIEHAVALLIVCCPCAAGLATPIATSAAIARLARQGVLVKGGDAFEALSESPTVLIDKTGTLTDGLFVLRRWVGDDSLQPVAAALERNIAHPLATALRGSTDQSAEVDNVEHTPGLGVTGTWRGQRVALGARGLIEGEGVQLPTWAEDEIAAAAEDGLTAVTMSVGGSVRAVAVLGDEVRPDAAPTLDTLRGHGWRIEMLSGDSDATVRTVANRLSIDEAEGGATPERKHERVQELLDGRERVVMVGDGVNDASALAAADVGIAVSGGAEASLAAADVYFNAPGLAPMTELVRTARGTVRVIRRCLAIALAYNTVAAALALAGLISPLVAAIIMPMSSITVVSLAVSATKGRAA